MVSGFKIRAITEADRNAVGLVGFAAWQSSNAFDNTYLDPVVIERVQEAFLTFAQNADCDIAIAEIDDTVVGWGACAGEPDYISDIWIDPSWQGKGIGYALVEHFLDNMRVSEIDVAKIATHAKNANAIRLYERCGFRLVWKGMQWSESMQVELEKVRLELHLRND